MDRGYMNDFAAKRYRRHGAVPQWTCQNTYAPSVSYSSDLTVPRKWRKLIFITFLPMIIMANSLNAILENGKAQSGCIFGSAMDIMIGRKGSYALPTIHEYLVLKFSKLPT